MKRKGFIFLLVAIPLVFLGYNYANEKYFLIAKNLDIFATLFKEVNAHYVDEIDPTDLVEVGIHSMLESLDPYTNFIPEEELDAFRTVTTGQYAGIGVLVGNINGKVKVTRVYHGFSAAKKGVEVGDEIISVSGVDIKNNNIPEIGKLLRGQPSSEVEVIIKRPPNNELLTLSLTRENIMIGNVPYYGMVNTQIGYIKLEDFAIGAGREVKEALISLKDNGAQSIILDIRGNGGGLLSEAINISNLFIDKGSEVVSTKGRIEDWNKTYKALNSPSDTSIPLAVLTDDGSASASEIVAGVLQDYDRAVLIGRNTFGKGLVQTTRPLTYNSQLKITTAKYYIPSGRCIQAINYDGDTPTEVKEAERVEFETENGRRVYDGSGLAPDIHIDEEVYSSLTRNLSYRGFLFDYAINYKYSGDIFGSPRDIEVTDSDYNSFIEWIQDQNFDYKTEMENNLDELIRVVKKEQYYDGLKSEISSLQRNIEDNKENDLINFKGEVVELLKHEIASVLFNHKGEIESSFNTDPDILKAVEILTNNSTYNEILGN